MTRKLFLLGLGLVTLAGCSTPNTTASTTGGALVGGAIGTGVGLLTRAPAAGMLIGAGTGALVGNAVGQAQDRKEQKQAVAAAQAYRDAHPPLTVQQVVEMANQGVPDAVIIQQMSSTGSVFNLTPADLEYLNQAHVSAQVVLAMQQRTVPGPVVVRPAPVYVVPAYPPPPPPVAVGVGVRF